jgi:glycerophosphoryl diester phosphodiesterase
MTPGESMGRPLLVLTVFVGLVALLLVQQVERPSTFFADSEFSRGRGGEPRVLVIAHRGGVVAEDSPENSATAIKRAIAAGYDGVEIDIQASRDGVPFLFHDVTMEKATGRQGTLPSLSAEEIGRIRYLGTDEPIIPFSTAVELAREKLILMLDIKGTNHSRQFYEEIETTVERAGMLPYTFALQSNAEVREALGARMRIGLNRSTVPSLLPALPDPTQKYHVTGLAEWLNPLPLAELRAAGVPVIIAINTFRYPPDRHMELAEKDIYEMLEVGIDALQIDSVYEEMTRRALADQPRRR